jgi:hypothetical protein
MKRLWGILGLAAILSLSALTGGCKGSGPGYGTAGTEAGIQASGQVPVSQMDEATLEREAAEIVRRTGGDPKQMNAREKEIFSSAATKGLLPSYR